jgi:hypothetical protein
MITKERRDTKYRIQCDACAGSIDLDEDCEYLIPPAGHYFWEVHLAHRNCASFFKGYWSRVTKPRYIIAEVADHNRNPVIIDFLRQLKQDRRNRLKGA